MRRRTRNCSIVWLQKSDAADVAETATLARPYARAAFQSAAGAGGFARWSEILARASECIANDQVAALIGSPRVSNADRLQLFVDAIGVGAAGGAASSDAAARNLLQLLTENRRLRLLPEIAAQFERMRAEAENTVDVTIVSAQPLTPEQSAKLSAALAKRLNAKIRLHTQVDPQLIGGAVVRAGDFVTDGSLRGRVERLAIDLTSA